MRETVFHRLLEFSVRHARLIVIGACLVTGVFGYFMTRVRIDPDVASVIPKHEKYTLLMEKYGEMEEEEDYLVLALESKDSYTPEDLALLEGVVRKIEQLPKAKPGITPFNMVTFEKNGRKLEVLPMAPGGRAPATVPEMEAFKKRLLRDPFARRFLVSGDGTILCVFIPTGDVENYSVFMEQFKEYISVLNDRFNVYYSGSLAFIYVMQKYLTSDLSKLISIALLVILFIYYIGFRTKRSVLLTFMVVVMGTIWTIGFMSLLGYAITVISIVTPPLILSLGSSYSIHMLNQYYRESGGVNGKIKDNGDASGRGWVTDAAAHINRTIVLAAITTVIGFSSLLVTTLEKTREFSISASFGIISCAILSLFMLPAILYHMKPPSKEQREKILEGTLSRAMEGVGKAVLKWRVAVLVFLVAIAAGYVVSLRYLKHETDIVSYFPKKERVVRDTRYITANVGGFQKLKITLSAPDGEKNYFLRRDVMEQISRLEEKLMANRNISNLFSFVSYVEFANEIMFNEYKVPDKKGLILLLSRYVKLLRARSVSNEIIRSLANDEFSRVTITLWIFDSNRMNLISDEPLRDLKEDIEGYIRETLDPALEPEIWGESMRYLSLSDIIRKDQRLSMLISLVLIFLLTTVGFKSFRYGLFAIIPLTTAIMFNFIFMAVADIPLDMTTVMFTSVVIGVGVDNAIHFLLQYRKQAEFYPDDREKRILETMVITGRPILLTTASIVGGLMVLTIANFQPVIYFGVLVSVTLLAAATGTLVILPAILSFVKDPAGQEQHGLPDT